MREAGDAGGGRAPDLAAGFVLLVDERDAEATFGGGDGGVGAGRAGPQHDQLVFAHAGGTPRSSTRNPARTGVRQAWRITPPTRIAHS